MITTAFHNLSWLNESKAELPAMILYNIFVGWNTEIMGTTVG